MEKLAPSVLTVLLSLTRVPAQLVKTITVLNALLPELQNAQLASLVISCRTVCVINALQVRLPQLIPSRNLLPTVVLPAQTPTVSLAQLLEHVLHAKLLSSSTSMVLAHNAPLTPTVIFVLKLMYPNVSLALLVTPSRPIIHKPAANWVPTAKP